MPKEEIIFTDNEFNDLSNMNEVEYIAFIYDADQNPLGTFTGTDSVLMSKYLKEQCQFLNQNYILVKVIEDYSGQTFH